LCGLRYLIIGDEPNIDVDIEFVIEHAKGANLNTNLPIGLQNDLFT